MELASTVKDDVTMKLAELLADGYTPHISYYRKAKALVEAVETLFGPKLLNDAHKIQGLTFLAIAETLLTWQTEQKNSLSLTLQK